MMSCSKCIWPLHHYIKDCWLCKHITVVADIYSLNLFRNNGIISRHFSLPIHTELRHLYTTNYIIFKKDCLWKLLKKYGGDCFLHLTHLYIFHGFSFLKVRLPWIILTPHYQWSTWWYDTILWSIYNSIFFMVCLHSGIMRNYGA